MHAKAHWVQRMRKHKSENTPVNATAISVLYITDIELFQAVDLWLSGR